MSATKIIGPIFFADHKFTHVLHCVATLNAQVVTGEPVPFFSKPVQQLTVFFECIHYLPHFSLLITTLDCYLIKNHIITA